MKCEEYYLMPGDGRKSFYNKALVKVWDDGCRELYSYNTLVMTEKDGKYVRSWGGYSATTMRHVRSFMGRAWNSSMWRGMEVGKAYTYREICGC